jgi:hypothetical protein
MVDWWVNKARIDPDDLLIAHGGSRTDFLAVQHPQKVFIDDDRLRTRDHTRERQSYRAIFTTAAGWMEQTKSAHTHIYFAEYDHLPLIQDLPQRLLASLTAEKADVLGLRVACVEDSSQPHYLHHAQDPRFHAFWESVSVRSDPRTILTMFGTGSFWTRAAFCYTATAPEPFPIYLELFLPTTAHHAGFRVRPYPDAAAHQFVHHLGNRRHEIDAAREAGAWTIHPLKSAWRRQSRLT